MVMFLFAAAFTKGHAQNVIVDERGVMRWEHDKKEIYGFGINYTAPFAHAFRSAKKLGIPLEEAIKNDVYHFARLGFDAYRVHVWDTEISDTLGNLLENEHLRLFDFMLNEMKQRGMKFILTPIAFWGNGWPEPAEKTPGFSWKYSKDACLTNEDAIKAQENYLAQFLDHVNPFTGLAYKEDPAIVAFEVSNEPHHRQPPDSVTRYIKKMVAAMRKTGCKKPIFYNISHSIHLVDAYFNAGIQGGTFQWYPTGLVAQGELKGNFLPNVDQYKIPFALNEKFAAGAKIVYEFDAADVGRSYIYPAMARSFRTAGMQWATHFAYDPAFLAYANTEYNTHYMNLAYTPQKAISLKIAGEVFHRVPLYKDYGSYPENARFDVFSVSYEKDRAEMVTEEKFFYTNHTSTSPPAPEKLEEIAGYGVSPIVRYDGAGAYFLDKIEKGIWRLEVMPDAIWVKDPFGRNSLDRKVAAINWREWPIRIALPDLGSEFSIQPLNDGNGWKSEVSNGEFMIRPGVYLLTRNGVKKSINPDQQWKNIRLNEYYAPATTLDKTYVLHEPIKTVCSGADYVIRAKVVDIEEPVSVEAVVYSGFRPGRYAMAKQEGYAYGATIPGSVVNEGILRYFLVVNKKDGSVTFPDGIAGSPGDWDFDAPGSYQVHVVDDASPVYIFNALTDNDGVSRTWTPGSTLVPLAEPGKGELRIFFNKLVNRDPENPKGQLVGDYSLRYHFGEKIAGRANRIKNVKELVFRGYPLTESTEKIRVTLIDKKGNAFGGMIALKPGVKEYRFALADLEEVAQAILPRPYPTFLPYYFQNQSGLRFDSSTVEVLQISVGPGLSPEQLDKKLGIAIESLRLE